MTKAGAGFIVAGGFLYLIANQAQIGWFYLFDAVIWGLLVLSAILPWYSIRSLRVECQVLLPTATQHVSQLRGPLEDGTVEVKLKVTNSGRLARHFIRVLADCPFAEPEERHRAFFLTSLKPRSTVVFSFMATAYRRGYYTSLSTTLQSNGPLGLLVRRRTFQLPSNLTVYPSYYQMEGLPVAEAAWADWGRAVRSSTPAEFYGSREYQYGEPLKHIHWRNTARLGRFMIKEFEEANQGSVTVVFGTGYDFGTGRETTLEYSIRIAASLARLGADSGRNVNIIAGVTPLLRVGWQEAMDYLAHLEVEEQTASAELMAAPEPDQVVVAIVSAVETRLITALSHLANRVRGVVVVLLEGFAPDEMSPEFLSRLKGSNFHIISCSRGNLAAAIEKLSNSPFFVGKSTVSAD